MSDNPLPPSGFKNDPQPPKLLPTSDPDTIIYQDTGMGAADRANTNQIIQTKVLMDVARLLNSQKNNGNGIPFAANAQMTITCWNSVPNQELTFQCSYIDPNGTLRPVPSTGTAPYALSNMDTITDDVMPNYQVVTMPDTGGVLTSFEARIAQNHNTTFRGQTLVKVEIDNLSSFNGPNVTIPSSQVIVHNYVYFAKDATYPAPDSIVDSTTGQGYRQSLTQNATATGSDVTILTVPTNIRYKVYTTSAIFGTGISSVVRTIQFRLLDNAANTIFATGALSLSKALTLYGLVAEAGYPSPVDAAPDAFNTARFFWPEETIPQGYQIITNTKNQQALDSWTSTRVDVEQWIEPNL